MCAIVDWSCSFPCVVTRKSRLSECCDLGGGFEFLQICVLFFSSQACCIGDDLWILPNTAPTLPRHILQQQRPKEHMGDWMAWQGLFPDPEKDSVEKYCGPGALDNFFR